MTTADPVQIALVGSWAATAVGLAMWLWSWVVEKQPVRQLRLRDSGLVLVFSAILVRVVIQERAMSPFDWVMVVIGPIFIAAALWRLARTGTKP